MGILIVMLLIEQVMHSRLIWLTLAHNKSFFSTEHYRICTSEANGRELNIDHTCAPTINPSKRTKFLLVRSFEVRTDDKGNHAAIGRGLALVLIFQFAPYLLNRPYFMQFSGLKHQLGTQIP